MKKTFTLVLVGIFCTFAATTLMAGPRGCPGGGGWGPGCRPCPPPPPCRPGWGGGYWGGGCWGGDRGLWNAAAITSIVANGIGIVRDLTYPTTVVAPAPVYTAPVVTTPAPVYTAPVVVPQPTYVTPAPVVVQPGAGVYVGPGAPAVRYYGY